MGASMILTPDKRTDMQLLETLKAFFLDIGFASLTFSDPEEHDRIIAFYLAARAHRLERLRQVARGAEAPAASPPAAFRI